MSELLFQQLLVFGLIMLIGRIATHKNILNSERSAVLSDILVNIANPCIILASYNIEYSKETLEAMGLVIFYGFTLVIASILLNKIFLHRVEENKRIILNFATILTNSAYMGFPLIAATFGQKGVMYTSIFQIVFNVMVWTYGDTQMSGVKITSPLTLFKKLITTPSLLAVIIGFLMFILRLEYPAPIHTSLNTVGLITAPLSMLIIGEKLSHIKLKEILYDKLLYYGYLLRLIVHPLISFVILKFLNAPKDIFEVMFMLQLMPSAMITVVLSDKNNLEPEFASKIVIMTHLLCLITIPILGQLTQYA